MFKAILACALLCVCSLSFSATRYFTDGSPIDVPDDTTALDTFTMGTTGFTSNPSGTASYQVYGRHVILSIPTLSGTSNSTAFGLTGLPTAIRPAATRNIGIITVTNGGLLTFGTLTINTDGTATVSAGALGTLFSALLGKGITSVDVAYLK